MIYVNNDQINARILANDKLSVGMDFLRLIRTEEFATRSDGIVPVIAGGAVRDGLFGHKTNREVNDIDIFFHRAVEQDGDAPTRTMGVARTDQFNDTLRNLRENILVWLEDNEIPFESLLSDAAAEYFGGQSFLDILSFEWRGVTIQIMIPNRAIHTSASAKNFLFLMPLMSGACLSLERLTMTTGFVASLNMPAGQVAAGTDRDLPYLRRKFPDHQVVGFNSSPSLVMYALGREYINTQLVSAAPTRVDILTSSNTPAGLSVSATKDFLNIEEAVYSTLVLRDHL